MSREAESEGDNSQGRIGKTAGWKNRATGDEKIRHAVHPALRIDHTVPGIVVHPRGTQEMMRAAESPRVGTDGFLHGDKSTDPRGS